MREREGEMERKGEEEREGGKWVDTCSLQVATSIVGCSTNCLM